MSPNRKLQEQRLQAAMDSRAVLRVRSVEALPDYCLRLSFSNGSQGVADLTDLIANSPALVRLKDPELFAQARLDLGAVVWTAPADEDGFGIGIATETLWSLLKI